MRGHDFRGYAADPRRGARAQTRHTCRRRARCRRAAASQRERGGAMRTARIPRGEARRDGGKLRFHAAFAGGERPRRRRAAGATSSTPPSSSTRARSAITRFFRCEMSWFYGEPIWHELPPEKQLMLNRLSLLPELSRRPRSPRSRPTSSTSQASLDTIVDDDPEVALYMAREVVEETMHVQAFLLLRSARCVAHYGLTLEQLRGDQRLAADGERYVRAAYRPRLAARRSQLLLLHALRAEREPEDRRALHDQRARHAPARAHDPEEPRDRRGPPHADVARHRPGRAVAHADVPSRGRSPASATRASPPASSSAAT